MDTRNCASCAHCTDDFRCIYWEFDYTEYEYVCHGGVRFAPLTCLFVDEPEASICNHWEEKANA